MYLEIEVFKSIDNPDYCNVFLSKNFIGQISLAESADFFTKYQLIDFCLRDVNKFKVSEDVIIKNIKKPNND